MSFLQACPIPRKRGLICSDCGIIFGTTGDNPITCWLIRLGDIGGIEGVRKIA
jgi:hypothetical protein